MPIVINLYIHVYTVVQSIKLLLSTSYEGTTDIIDRYMMTYCIDNTITPTMRNAILYTCMHFNYHLQHHDDIFPNVSAIGTKWQAL